MGYKVSLNEIITDGVVVTDTTSASHDYSERARRHLWLHFSRMGAYSETAEIPVFVRGEKSYVWDANGKKYIDGLSGLFTSNLGHGRADIAEVAAAQMRELAYFPLWTYAHPTAIDLAEKLAQLAPGDLNRVFFTSGGGEAVESALKLARQWHAMRGETGRYKVISRHTAYHGTTMGALTVTGVEPFRTVFEPLVPGAIKVPTTNFYRTEVHADDPEAFGLWHAQQIEDAIVREGPETIAAVFLEPVQNSGGCFTPPPGYWQKVREICTKYGVLLVSDEVICAFGRLGYWFGAERYDYVPDIITTAKGITSGYAPLGAMIVSDRIADTFMQDDRQFLHGFTFAGHPVSCAVALKNIEILENEKILENVRSNEPYWRESLESLKDLPIVGDIRGAGHFWATELVMNQETKESFVGEKAERLLRGFISPEMFRRGIVCRIDDRGDPVVQFSPPLIVDRSEIDMIVGTFREVLTEAVAKI